VGERAWQVRDRVFEIRRLNRPIADDASLARRGAAQRGHRHDGRQRAILETHADALASILRGVFTSDDPSMPRVVQVNEEAGRKHLALAARAEIRGQQDAPPDAGVENLQGGRQTRKFYSGCLLPEELVLKMQRRVSDPALHPEAVEIVQYRQV